ncbi:group II intron maturase-specific domain-containing protein [Caldifermentibacillus hisashii]|uniref:group II intron maturase-specific domain-containing protein n=1 Tax=Caldifermentibacillus hisashii TaxID=996558 RepID=UPI0031018278
MQRETKKSNKSKTPGSFKEIITKINQIITGWINYYGVSNMRKFIIVLFILLLYKSALYIEREPNACGGILHRQRV